jgi:hypothetical protein
MNRPRIKKSEIERRISERRRWVYDESKTLNEWIMNDWLGRETAVSTWHYDPWCSCSCTQNMWTCRTTRSRTSHVIHHDSVCIHAALSAEPSSSSYPFANEDATHGMNGKDVLTHHIEVRCMEMMNEVETHISQGNRGTEQAWPDCLAPREDTCSVAEPTLIVHHALARRSKYMTRRNISFKQFFVI